jgi:hypothetical protein
MNNAGDINRRRVMATRHYGWEKATATQLGRIFQMDQRTVHAELRRAVCKVCRQAICTHSDLEYAGLKPLSQITGGILPDARAGIDPNVPQGSVPEPLNNNSCSVSDADLGVSNIIQHGEMSNG